MRAARTLPILALLWASSLRAQETETLWLAHLSANEQFQSELQLRNDGFDRSRTFHIAFFASDGTVAEVVLIDNAGTPRQETELALTLDPQTSAKIQLQAVTGGDDRSLQARVTVPADGLSSVEADFSGFEGTRKVNKVGVPVGVPARLFRINVDGAPDARGVVEVRGLGITNTDDANDCACVVTLVGADGRRLDTSIVRIPPLGKWLGPASSLFPEDPLDNGMGFLDASCSEPVVVQALAFEGQILSSVPVRRYDLNP